MLKSWATAFLGLGTVLCVPSIGPVWADCAMEGGGEPAQAVFKFHMSSGCTETERESHAIDASKVLTALGKGQTIDLSGVVIRGDLAFNALQPTPNPPAIDDGPIQGIQKVRMIAGGVSIMNSSVRGPVTHRAKEDVLLFVGPVSFAGTEFQQLVDLSRSVFVEPLTLSGAVFLRESYFVQARFHRGVLGEKTAFGPHVRFHLSRFNGPVTFQQSGFGGLAEFLETTFEQDANFSRTYFKSGTGFSGAQFKGLADFSEALFTGDAFFTFTRFDGDAFFRRATFRSTADFDDAEFNGREDFSKVFFEKGPQFTRAKRGISGSTVFGIENPQIQYVITLSLLVFSVLLIAYLIRSK